MLNSYNPYNIISLDMSSKDKANDKPYVGTRIFPVSFYTTTDEGNIIPNTYQSSSIEFPLLAVVGQSQNYDYSEAQLENETPTKLAQTETTTARAGSFLAIPWLLTYCNGIGIFNFYDEDNPADIIAEIQNIYNYANDNALVINQDIGDRWHENDSDHSGFVIGIASDGTLHALALDLQFNSDNTII